MDENRRFSKVHVLEDGRVGTTIKLGLRYRAEQLTMKNKKRRTRAKLIAQIRGDQELNYKLDYIPERRRNKWKKKYWGLKQRLLHPDYRQQRKDAVEKQNRLLQGPNLR